VTENGRITVIGDLEGENIVQKSISNLAHVPKMCLAYLKEEKYLRISGLTAVVKPGVA
jgi:hypothetical protein